MGGWRVRRVSLHPLPVLPALSSSAISAFCANESPARNESSSANVLSSGYADFSFSRVFSFLFQRPLCLVWPDNGLVSCFFRYYSRDGCIRLFIIVPLTFFFSMKIKKCVLIIYKSSVDVFFFSVKIKKCALRGEKKKFRSFSNYCALSIIYDI